MVCRPSLARYLYSPLEAAGAELRQTLGRPPAVGGCFHDVTSELGYLVSFNFLPDYGCLVKGDIFFGDDLMSLKVEKTWLLDTYNVKDGSSPHRWACSPGSLRSEDLPHGVDRDQALVE